MKDLFLSVVSPEKCIFEGYIKSITLPGTKGSFTILPQHAPIVSSLQNGTLIYVTANGEEQTLNINGGFIELNNNVISTCVLT